MLRLFRGLVHTVVNRIIKTEEPDFLMETHTATIGVRGTDWYTLLGPNSTGVYLPGGILGVSSNLPTVPGLVRLQSRQFTQVLQGLPPSVPQALTPEILKMLEKLMDTGLTDGGLGFGQPAGGTGTQYKTPLTLPGSPDQKILQQTIPPVLVPQHQTPAPVQPPPSGSGPTGTVLRGPTGIVCGARSLMRQSRSAAGINDAERAETAGRRWPGGFIPPGVLRRPRPGCRDQEKSTGLDSRKRILL